MHASAESHCCDFLLPWACVKASSGAFLPCCACRTSCMCCFPLKWQMAPLLCLSWSHAFQHGLSIDNSCEVSIFISTFVRWTFFSCMPICHLFLNMKGSTLGTLKQHFKGFDWKKKNQDIFYAKILSPLNMLLFPFELKRIVYSLIHLCLRSCWACLAYPSPSCPKLCIS